jgi:magnesium chelatase subunit I
VWLRAARAHAAWRGASRIAAQDIDAVSEFALRHRRRESPPAQSPASGPQDSAAQSPPKPPEQGEGSWGEMAAQPVAIGRRREVPSWPKKP